MNQEQFNRLSERVRVLVGIANSYIPLKKEGMNEERFQEMCAMLDCVTAMWIGGAE